MSRFTGHYAKLMMGSGGPLAISSGAVAWPGIRPTQNAHEVFLLEMQADHEERAFLNALWKNHKDEAVRQQYVDWLLEKNRQASAELVRGGYTPGMH